MCHPAGLMRLEQILQRQGFGTRKECRRRIEAGQVTVAGVSSADPGAEFGTEGLEFSVDGVGWRFREQVYLAMNKPAGLECSRRPDRHASVFELLAEPLVARGVQCVGRLDEATTGLLLFSDDGQFVHALTSPRRHVPKVYEVHTAEPVTDAQVASLKRGVTLHDESGPLAAVDCERRGERGLRLTLAEGRYHQVRRMVAAAGNSVVHLHRAAIGAFELPASLAAGQWMYLEPNHLELLRR